MQGAPPSPERQVRFADMGHFQFPRTRWSFANMRQLVPSTQVWRGAGPPSALPRSAGDATAREAAIDTVAFTPISSSGGSQPMTWAQSLLANYTDAICVLHRGRIVYERYAGVMQPHKVHMAMSVTKSYTGTLAEMLVHERALDATRRVPHYVPELAGTAYEDATVRDVMDMRIGVRYSEDYANPDAEVWQHVRAGGFFPQPAGYQGPTSFYGFLRTLRKEGQHGQNFYYKTVSTDVLGWIIRRVAGQSLGDVLSARLWQPLGCEEDACLLVDSEGTEFAGGGLNPVLRDMARFGECMRLGGRFNGRQIVPQVLVEGLVQAGSGAELVNAFKASGPPTLPGAAYRSMWWMINNAHGAFAARGVHGQAIYIDPKAEMVIARFGSHPLAANVHFDPTSLPAFEALARWLMAN